MRFSELPGIAGAIRRADRLQDYWRDYTFLGLDEEIRVAGTPETREARRIRVRLLSLQMFIELCAVRSPFLVGGLVRPEHILQILWRLSPQYDPRNSEARTQFIASVADLPFRPAIRSISRYLDRMLIDKPASSESDTGGRPDTSFAASVVHALACTYGWSDQTILRLPMPALFQYLRKIQRENDPEAIVFNPLRDKFTQRIFRKYLNQTPNVQQPG